LQRISRTYRSPSLFKPSDKRSQRCKQVHEEMKRRKFLQAMGAAPLLSVAGAPLVVPARGAPAPLRRVRPGDPAWPAPARWQALEADVAGNLIKVERIRC
jgi:hypothetical protein